MSIVIDGVVVMIGKRNGLVVKFRFLNKKMILFYCVCYRLVLFCVDVNDEVNYIFVVEIIL